MSEDTVKRELKSRGSVIETYLKEFLSEKKEMLGTVNRWGADVPERIFRKICSYPWV